MKRIFSNFTRYIPLFSICMTGCSTNWRRDAQSLDFLPIGLEFAENLGNLTNRIDGHVRGSSRFQGVDFFQECFHSMSGNKRVWYALLYSAHHRLEGESLLTFRIATKGEKIAIVRLARQLRKDDWDSIGLCLGVDGQLASERVKGVFEN